MPQSLAHPDSMPFARRRFLHRMLLASVLPWGLQACRAPDLVAERLQQADGVGDLWVGLSWPLQHPKRTLRNGMELALDDINAKGGVLGRRLRMQSADDERSVDQGMLVAQQFAQNRAMIAAVAHLDTHIATQVAPTYAFNGMLMMSPGALDMELTRKNQRMVFRSIPNQHVVGTALANHMARVERHRVVVYYSNDNGGRDLVSAFEAQARLRRIEVVDRRPFNPVGSDHTLVFEEWRELHSFDAILLAGSSPQGAEILRLLRQTGLRQPVFGGMEFDGHELIDLAGEAAEGLVAVSVFHPDMPLAHAQGFMRAYRKRYRTQPDATAAIGHDTLQLLAEAIRQAKSARPERIAQALRHLKPWAGITGSFSFDDQGDLHSRPVVLNQVRDGAWVYLNTQGEYTCKVRRSSEGLIKEC